MPYLIALLVILFTPLVGSEETLPLRRITLLVEEKDYSVARRECEEFINKHPQSSLKESIYGLLCELSIYEKEYAKSLSYFDKIKEPDLKNKLIIKRWTALYELNRFTTLKEELSEQAPLFSLLKENDRPTALFFYAEALNKEALHLLASNKTLGESLLKQSVEFYQKIESSHYDLQAKMALAEAARLLEDPKKAAKYYLELSEAFPSFNTKFLLERGKMLAMYDKKEALQVFSSLTKKGESSAALEWLMLLIEEGKADEIIFAKDTLFSSLPKNFLPLAHYIIGIVYLQNHQYKESIDSLTSFLENKANKDAFLIAKAKLLQKWAFYSIGQEASLSEDELRKSIKICEEKKEKELLQYGYLFLIDNLINQKKWKESKELIITKIQNQNTKNKLLTFFYIKQLQLGEIPSPSIKEEFQTILASQIYDKTEAPIVKLSYAAILASEKKFSEALILLNDIEKLFDPKSMEGAKCRFLLSVIALEEGRIKEALYWGERALLGCLAEEEKSQLHLHLYNLYIKDNNETTSEKAAFHLFESLKRKASISLETQLWLSKLLYHRTIQNTPSFILSETLDKAISVYEKIFQEEKGCLLEEEAMQLVILYQKKGDLKKAKNLLEKYHFQGAAQFILANLYLEENNEEKAFLIYQSLLEDPHYHIPSALQYARLKLKRGESNLDHLEQIASKRNPQSEPFHVEASLEMILLQTKSSSLKPDNILQRLELLRKLKDSYDNLHDEYFNKLNENPRREKMFAAYYRFIEAEILSEEAKVAKSMGNLQESARKQRAAKAFIASLKQEKFIVSEILHSWMESSPINENTPNRICPIYDFFNLPNKDREFKPKIESASYPSFFVTLPLTHLEEKFSPAFGDELVAIKNGTHQKSKDSLPSPSFNFEFTSLSDSPSKVWSDSFDLKVEAAPKRARPGYVFKVTLLPKNSLTTHSMKHHVTFLLDRSSSMSRSCYIHYRKALFEALHHLNEGDTFSILIFDNTIDTLSDSPLALTEENITKARHFLEKHAPGGIFASTDIYSSLSKIVPHELPEDVIHTAILLSNGESYLRQENQRRVISEWTERNNGRVSLFIVSTKSNLPQLELFTRFNKGNLVFAKTDEEISKRLGSLMESISLPLAKSILATACTSDKKMLILLQPKNSRLPILYQKKPYVIYGSTNHLSEFTLFLQGRYQDNWFEIKKKISLADADPGLYSLENEWTQFLAEDFFEKFFKDGRISHLEQAKLLLEPLNLSVPFLTHVQTFNEDYRRTTSRP